jgi:hypothetical protein
MEVGQRPNWGCGAKEKKKLSVVEEKNVCCKLTQTILLQVKSDNQHADGNKVCTPKSVTQSLRNM